MVKSLNSTHKADKSVFTIADGIVQELLTQYLYAGEGKFCAVVGEEDESKCNIQQRPYTVDTLTVPAEFADIIDATREMVSALAARIPAGPYAHLTIFIDPIDGTREFSTGKGSQCSICIGFADSAGMPVAGIVYRPIPVDDCHQPEPAVTDPAATAASPRSGICSWAAGAASEGCAIGKLDVAPEPKTDGFLTSNGSISAFIQGLMQELAFQRVPAGGAGNKMMMLLEGCALYCM